MNTIISFCGGKKTEIIKLIDAYTDMITYYFPAAQKAEMDPDPSDFSKFAELQNRSIKQSLLNHKYTEADFAEWVINRNIDTAQNVRKLPAILSNPLAKSEFLKSNISEAVKYLNVDEKGSKGLDKATMDDLVVELTKRCRKIELSYIKSLRNDPRYTNIKEHLFDLMDELKDVIDEVEDKTEED